MKKLHAASLLLILTSSSHARSAAEVAAVTVYVKVDLADPALIPFSAESLASRMFANAGVRIQWRRGQPKLDESEALIVDITSHTPAACHPGALAYASAFEGVHIRILWDRVKKTATSPGLANKLLAHVTVHEITHVLQRSNRHSETGIMKAHWADSDILQMGLKPLSFEDADIQFIHHGLASRTTASSTVPANAKAAREPRR